MGTSSAGTVPREWTIALSVGSLLLTEFDCFENFLSFVIHFQVTKVCNLSITDVALCSTSVQTHVAVLVLRVLAHNHFRMHSEHAYKHRESMCALQ